MPTLWSYYQHEYRPKRHPLKSHDATRRDYEVQISNLNKAYRFRRGEAGQTLRDVELADLSDELLRYAMTWLVDCGRAEATANKLRRAIKAIWTDAHKAGLLPAACTVEKFKEPKLEPRAWSLDELAAILEQAHAAPGYVGAAPAHLFFPAYLWFLYATGARIGVTLAVPAANYDRQRGEILLPAALQKHRTDQTVTLRPECVAALDRLNAAGRGLARLFGDYRPKNHGPLNKRLAAIIRAAGLECDRKAKSHKLRKTFATHVAAASNPATAQTMLGHSHPSVTARYLDPRYTNAPSARDLVPPLPSLYGDDPPPALRLFAPPDDGRAA